MTKEKRVRLRFDFSLENHRERERLVDGIFCLFRNQDWLLIGGWKLSKSKESRRKREQANKRTDRCWWCVFLVGVALSGTIHRSVRPRTRERLRILRNGSEIWLAKYAFYTLLFVPWFDRTWKPSAKELETISNKYILIESSYYRCTCTVHGLRPVGITNLTFHGQARWNRHGSKDYSL